LDDAKGNFWKQKANSQQLIAKRERFKRVTEAKQKPPAKETGQPAPERRRLLKWLWGALSLAAVGELSWIGISFITPRRRAAAADPSAIVVAGPVDDFEPGTVTAFPAGQFYLVRLDNGGFLALDRTCTHLGCTVPWKAEEGQFACPCHASVFDITGQVLSPPAPRPLDLYPVRIENHIVKVDTGHSIRRSEFRPSQAVRS
jgi:cytochrome b6-f complex iron-sulfur subunit